jgi:DNA-binding MarR family transcriptional regulator
MAAMSELTPPCEPWYDRVSIPALLRHARSTYGDAMRAALDAAGFEDIPGNGLYVIGGLALGEAGGEGGVPITQLVRDLGVSRQTAGQLVDTLVARGYLDRVPDPADRRQLIVSLTERGRAAAEVQGAARDAIDVDLLTRIGPEAVAVARRALGTLIEMRRAAEGDC